MLVSICAIAQPRLSLHGLAGTCRISSTSLPLTVRRQQLIQKRAPSRVKMSPENSGGSSPCQPGIERLYRIAALRAILKEREVISFALIPLAHRKGLAGHRIKARGRDEGVNEAVLIGQGGNRFP